MQLNWLLNVGNVGAMCHFHKVKLAGQVGVTYASSDSMLADETAVVFANLVPDLMRYAP